MPSWILIVAAATAGPLCMIGLIVALLPKSKPKDEVPTPQATGAPAE